MLVVRNESQDSEIPGLPSDDEINGGFGDGGLGDPFGELDVDLTESELRETAYEIIIGVHRSSGSSRRLTYVSSSKKSGGTAEKALTSVSSSSSLHQSVRSLAKSKVKRALGLESRKKDSDSELEASQTQNSVSQDSGGRKKGATVGEMMRIQMKVSEQTDSRVRRALLRIAAGQLGRHIESIVLPLELLEHYKPSDFPNEEDYELCQKRNLKLLEFGVLLHPHLPLDETTFQHLRQIIQQAQEKRMDTGKHSEQMQELHGVVSVLACRSFDGSVSSTCHWADGIPLNLRLYQILLSACFDVNEETSLIEEVDELLELIKKTWVVLGLDQMFHNLCFLWVLFNRYVNTGQVEIDLPLAAENMLLEVEKDAKEAKEPAYFKTLSSILNLIFCWVEKKLSAYHEAFYRGNIEAMQSVVTLGVKAAKILVQDVPHEYHKKGKEVDFKHGGVEAYIRSSLRNSFYQVKENMKSSNGSPDNRQSALPAMCILATNISDLAFNEKEIYSPVLKRWHPLATGVAVATLHACFGKELKNFILRINELTPDAIQVLIAADKLEKDLIQMAVIDSVDSEDGGKAIIREMIPYEAETVIANLVKSWITTRVERLTEWVERNLQQEVWNPKANRERFAPSAVEVLRMVDEALEAFFLLPISMHSNLLPELLSGLDICIQTYILKAKSGCGSRSTFLPVMPPLTRCKSLKLDVFTKKDMLKMVRRRKSQDMTRDGEHSFGMRLRKKSHDITRDLEHSFSMLRRRKSHDTTQDANQDTTQDVHHSFSIPQLCIRINTLYHIQNELENLVKRANSHLRNAGCVHDDDVASGLGTKFESSVASCAEGIQQLSEATAYKIVFHELDHVFWDYLYMDDVSSSRIEPFLDELEKNLEVISATIHDSIRTQVITDVMRASFEGFLLVLLSGGPTRAFTVEDTSIIDEDLKFLKDLFWSNGDGLPTELIDKSSITLKDILTLHNTDTESLVEQYKKVVSDTSGAAADSKLPLPPTSGQWSRTDPNTILRVLCHRNDKIASKFLKRTYSLPKRL